MKREGSKALFRQDPQRGSRCVEAVQADFAPSFVKLLPQTVTGGADLSHESWRADLVGPSESMGALLDRAYRFAATDAPLSIFGASGTGRKSIAVAVHRASPRARSPVIAVNCAAIPEGLGDAELFGLRKGAFATATGSRAGLFEAAQHGTLILDHACSLPLTLQERLLSTIEEGKITPVGSTEAVAVDVRVICATSRRLEERIGAGVFREDLYFRISAAKLSVPSLAERRGDIPSLVDHFLTKLARQHSRPVPVFSGDAMAVLVSAAWPGNVRDLRQVVERAARLTDALTIPLATLRKAFDEAGGSLVPLDEARRTFEHDYLIRILEMTSGNVTHAARLAGRNRTEFYRLLDRHALQPGRFKARTGSSL